MTIETVLGNLKQRGFRAITFEHWPDGVLIQEGRVYAFEALPITASNTTVDQKREYYKDFDGVIFAFFFTTDECNVHYPKELAKAGLQDERLKLDNGDSGPPSID